MFIFFRRRKLETHFAMAVKDGVLTEAESRQLIELAGDLNVEQTEVERIRRDHFKRITQPIIAEVTKARRLSPAHEAKLSATAERLGITPQLDLGSNLGRSPFALQEHDPIVDGRGASGDRQEIEGASPLR